MTCKQRTRCGIRSAQFAMAMAIVFSVSARAETLTLTPIKDNTIFEDNVNFSGGISSFVFIGPIASGSPRRTLLQFDLSAIPPGSQINSASLRFVVNRAAIGSGAEDLARLHRLTNSWGEGASDAGTGGAGTQATPEDATWAYRFYGNPGAGVPRISWTNAGGDFQPTASAELTVIGAGIYTFSSTPALQADVSTWVNNQASNHGWILIGPEGPDLFQKAKRIVSRESPSVGERPALTIDFTPPPAAVSAPAVPIAALWGFGMLLATVGMRRRGGR